MQARQLTRSQTDRRIGGVCAGIAEYFDFDPTLVRIAFVAAALLSGVGIPLYIVLWIVLPKGDPNAPAASPGQRPSAIKLAEERYARGEISVEELQQIRSDLGRV